MQYLDNMLQGFEDRMKNIGVYAPILALANKKKFSDLPLISLSIAVLLYILENMLRDNKSTTNDELTYFIQDILEARFQRKISEAEAEEIRELLVDECLRNEGKPHSFQFYSFEKEREEDYLFRLIEFADIDEARQKRVHLRLSTQGIELLFKTKEMYNELQISITQLYFKQQLQKGLFDAALRSIEELTISIRNERHKIKDLQSWIIRDALDVARRNELESQLQRRDEQVKGERERFNELRALVNSIIESQHNGQLSKQEEQGMNVVRRIDQQLTRVISLHESLFTDLQRLQHIMTDSLESLILNAFSVKLNFEREVLSEAITNGASLEVLHHILKPIYPLKWRKSFNPNSSFNVQKRQTRTEEKKEEIPVLSEEEQLKIEEEQQAEKARKEARQLQYLYILLTPLLQVEKTSVSSILEQMKQENVEKYEELTGSMNFYSFLIDLHQSDTNRFEQIPVQMRPFLPSISRCLATMVDQNPEFLDAVGSFTLTANDEEIIFESGFKVSDITIQRGNLYALAK